MRLLILFLFRNAKYIDPNFWLLKNSEPLALSFTFSHTYTYNNKENYNSCCNTNWFWVFIWNIHLGFPWSKKVVFRKCLNARGQQALIRGSSESEPLSTCWANSHQICILGQFTRDENFFFEKFATKSSVNIFLQNNVSTILFILLTK